MAPHSGVIAYDFLDRPFPVVGWYTYDNTSGQLVVMPLILVEGVLEPLNDAKVKFALVGNLSEQWQSVLEEHNAAGR